jgi:hypothetical protein
VRCGEAKVSVIKIIVYRSTRYLLILVAACGGMDSTPPPTPLTLGFGAATVAPAGAIGAKSQSLALADLDGDGDLDIAVADTGDNRAGVFLNSGGVFGSELPFPVAGQPVALAAGKINADERLDLVTASSVTNSASFLAGNGAAGVLDAAVDIALLTTPSGIALADFDGDGDTDAAFPDATGSLKVLLNAGGAAIAAELQDNPANGKVTSPRGAVAADFSGDGVPDVAVVDFGGDRVALWINDGTVEGGLFPDAAIVTLGLPPQSAPQGIAAGDLDGDGAVDLVVPLPGNNNQSVMVFLNGGAAGFDRGTAFPAGSDSFQAAIADLDNDGILDVVSLDFLAGNIAVLLGTGDGTLQPQQLFATGRDGAGAAIPPRSLAIGDLDGDGKLDVVVASDLGRAVSTIPNTSQ